MSDEKKMPSAILRGRGLRMLFGDQWPGDPSVDQTEEQIRERLMKAGAAFRILIYSWARYEDEQTDQLKRRVRDARLEWGKYAEEFFEEDDGSIPPTDVV